MADTDQKIHDHTVISALTDGSSCYVAGDHCVRPPGAIHSAYSEQGAVVLVIYTPL